MGFTSHGSTGSTDVVPQNRNLRILNRSLLPGLDRIRIGSADVLWRYWPRVLPNADADGNNNQPVKPAEMPVDGTVNFLPWEQAPFEAQPWKRTGEVDPNGVVAPGINPSQDYPDIARSALSAVAPAGGNPLAGLSTLPGTGSNNFSQAGTGSGGTIPAAGPNVGVRLNVRVPVHQPANLVAINNLTSTYERPNPAEGGSTVQSAAPPGPIQLPRGVDSRRLTILNPDTANTGTLRPTQNPTIVPFGYTVRLMVYYDQNENGRWDGPANVVSQFGVDPNNPQINTANNTEEAYRVFEVWFGVPVDIRLRTQESVIDVGALAHGFGQQNGLMGYGVGSNPLNLGIAPPPLAPLNNPYSGFFRTYHVQNEGNVNLWNLRAAQFAMVPQNNYRLPLPLILQSDTVDSRFGLSAAGKDPRVNSGGLVPQVLTSLDAPYDAVWNSLIASTTYPTELTAYKQQLLSFGGRHTLHKQKAGITNPTLLALPDSPENLPVPATLIARAAVGVSVPIGTPSGVYSGPLVFFEDYDTPLPTAGVGAANEYRPAPILQGGGPIPLPAGPLYAGTNLQHPGNNPILPGREYEGILRPQRKMALNNTLVPDFLPSTRPSPALKVTVTESALTGQRPDTVGSAPPSIVSGLLPFVDPFPLLDPPAASLDDATARQAAALSPAAFRSALNGSLHTYFSRNAVNGAASTRPGSAFSLFRSSLQWDMALGTWVAANPGEPTDNPKRNQGHWFTDLVAMNVGAAGSSNVSPYVLHEVQRNQNGVPTAETATLFWLNSANTTGGAPVTTLWYVGLDNAGLPAGQPQQYLPNADPTIRRYAPKAVTIPTGNAGQNAARDTLFLFYYGGAPGRWSLFYSASNNNNGVPGGPPAQRREAALNIPAALSSVSEPSAIAHYSEGLSAWVLDVFYTGISRANQNPDIYMTRYRTRNAGAQARLEPVLLPRIEGERLSGGARDPVWAGKHIAWSRGLGGRERPLLPEVFIQANGRGPRVPIRRNTRPQGQATSQQLGWQYDDATGLLYQSFERTVNGRRTLNVVYVDPSAGTVRFRGEGTPTSSDIVTADYTPQTHRITQDTVTDVGASTFLDRTVLYGTLNDPGNRNPTGTVIRRPNPDPFTIDRQWIVWQKGAEAGRASTLFYATRRVGIDLEAIGAMSKNESILLGPRNAAGNQAVAVTSFTVQGVAVPYDVDFETGRIFVSAIYDGLPYNVTFRAIELDDNGRALGPDRSGGASGVLNFINEQASAQMVPMQRSVNEGQAQAFLDLFDPRAGFPDRAEMRDPTLMPGRVWLFWSSPRGRAYDVYWQTIAPNFESRSFSGAPPAP